MLVELLHLLRNFRRSRTSATAAVLTLSLTLGVAASIFAVVDAALLTPPPFADPDSLVRVGEVPVDDSTSQPRAIRATTFDAWRDRAGALATLGAFDGTNLTLTKMGAAERVSATDVSPGFLSLLGATPTLGRLLSQDDVGRPVVVISHAFWRSKLAADPGAIGRDVVLGGRAHTIVGVLPERFFFALSPGDLWRPLPVPRDADARMAQRVRVVARLAPNVSPEALADALEDVSAASSPAADVVATRIATAIAGNATRPLALLAGAAVVALLVAFVNLTGLLVVRSIDRRRELAVRSALGARRTQIARQFLLETLALVAMGILGGVWLAWWLTPIAGRLLVERFGIVTNREIILSWQVIVVVSIAASVFACVCGSLLTLVATRRNVVDMLRRGTTPPPRELLLRRIIVTSEVALAFILLVSMTLLGRSLVSMLDVNPGFDGRGVLTMRVSLPAASYPSDERVATFYRALQSALEDRLGRGAVAVVDELPLTGDRGRTPVSVRSTDVGREAVVRVAGPAYFDVMRIPVVAGRPFDRGDDASAPPRVVVSESVANRLFGNDSSIGRRIWLAGPALETEIVGVVGDVKHRALDEPLAATVYLSAWQAPSPSSHVVVRSTRPEADVLAIARQETARLDSDLPVYAPRQMQDIIDTSPGVPARRVLTATFTGFALLALVLGAIGLFGVVAHDVAQRRGDLALRIALGANPMRLLRATLG
ncbi:MAG TPA: ABC transporter permease, partial [Vicinamibacterales bacterium]|nr:ABC transporter permease [Vicinamibacterales bacterium]